MTQEQELITRARAGDRAALEELLAAVKDLIYNLSIRMLGSPADAEDASQEIFLRLITNLDGFRGESAFTTWAYRVAANHLLKTRKRPMEARFESFEAMAEYLDEGVSADRMPLEDAVLVEEAKLRCTSAMMCRLDRDHRLAFILGEIFELSSEEAAAVAEISPEAYRKRLSRARARMADFARSTCGLVNPAAPCRCAKQAGHAAAAGHLDMKHLEWTRLPVRSGGRPELVQEIDGLREAFVALRSHPHYAAPEGIVEGLKQLLAPSRRGAL